MEPVTHVLTGACLARSGFNRRAAYATVTMAVAAEFPDIDTAWAMRGPLESFQHHRGITHTFLGLPFEAAFLVAVVYAWHRYRVVRTTRRASLDSASGLNRMRSARAVTAVPVHWGRLYGLALLALLSHLLLDYTNNYGLRPFYPFNPHWYAASIVFIFDPLIFVLLAAGLLAPVVFGLVSSEIGVKKRQFPNPGWAIAALVGVLTLWTLREFEHTRALQLALAQSVTAPQASSGLLSQDNGSAQAGSASAEAPARYLTAQRALVSPDPLSPFQWPSVIDFGPVYQLAQIDTRNSTVTSGQVFQPKPARTSAILAAQASPLGRIYMDWSPMPFINQSEVGNRGSTGGLSTESPSTVVLFRDPRFMGRVSLLNSSGETPLSGVVTLDAAGQVVQQALGGRKAP